MEKNAEEIKGGSYTHFNNYSNILGRRNIKYD